MYRNMLVAVDLTDVSSWKKALPTAVELCKTFGATLHLLAVVPDFGMTVVGQYFPENYAAESIKKAEEELRDLAARNVPGDIPVKPRVAFGTVYEEILSAARKIGADLIVMASHRPGLEDYLLGPNAARVVRHAGCSVMVVRDGSAER